MNFPRTIPGNVQRSKFEVKQVNYSSILASKYYRVTGVLLIVTRNIKDKYTDLTYNNIVYYGL